MVPRHNNYVLLLKEWYHDENVRGGVEINIYKGIHKVGRKKFIYGQTWPTDK
jgi:hypothetical protein